MKLFIYFASINFRNVKLCWPCIDSSRKLYTRKVYNECSVGSSPGILMPSYTRNFMIYALKFRKQTPNYEGNSNKERNGTESGTTDSYVSVIHENKEIVMSMTEAHKFAKRRNMKLVKAESSGSNKVKYKLQKFSGDGPGDSKKGEKKVILREDTQPHDVQTKINQMLKHLQKGLNVTFIIEGEGKKNQGRVVEILEGSELKDFFATKVEKSKSIQMKYTSKSTVKKNAPEQDKESSKALK